MLPRIERLAGSVLGLCFAGLLAFATPGNVRGGHPSRASKGSVVEPPLNA